MISVIYKSRYSRSTDLKLQVCSLFTRSLTKIIQALISIMRERESKGFQWKRYNIKCYCKKEQIVDFFQFQRTFHDPGWAFQCVTFAIKCCKNSSKAELKCPAKNQLEAIH